MSTQRTIFQGEFGEILIPDLLTFLDMLGKTGSLKLCRADITKHIYWQSGEIIFADSTDPSEHLGEHLVRNGWVSRQELEAARAKAASPPDIVKRLIRAGSLRPDLLPKSERSLVLDIVYSIFEWRDGTFRFDLTGEPHSDRVVLKTSVSNIIMEGSRRLDEWKRIREAFPSDDVFPFRQPGSSATTLRLPATEMDVLSQVDGKRTIADIVANVEHDHFTVLNALLTLSSGGLVGASSVPVDSGAAHDGLSPEDREAAAGVLHAFNAIFENMRERIGRIKGKDGALRFDETIGQPAFQRGPLAGAQFNSRGHIPPAVVLGNLASIPAGERLPKLKGTLDRLLAKQVLMLDTSVPAAEKQAISDLIARQKASLGEREPLPR